MTSSGNVAEMLSWAGGLLDRSQKYLNPVFIERQAQLAQAMNLLAQAEARETQAIVRLTEANARLAEANARLAEAHARLAEVNARVAQLQLRTEISRCIIDTFRHSCPNYSGWISNSARLKVRH
jgi:DNA repair exonuclease SbcCD ATPase subunit